MSRLVSSSRLASNAVDVVPTPFTGLVLDAIGIVFRVDEADVEEEAEDEKTKVGEGDPSGIDTPLSINAWRV